jgi:antitoxin component YwqK of YwqJK toxin-antitoxin module
MKYFLFFLLAFQSIFAQDVNKLDEKGLKNGPWKGYYDDSKLLRYEGNFVHGIETGMFTYYANSDKKIVMGTRNFTGNGTAYTIFYDENKNKVSEGNIINKLREGVWKYYHRSSVKIMTTENYIKDKLEGARKVYYPNGKIAEETNYVNNEKEGVSKNYTEKGILIEEDNYSKGKMNGYYYVYDDKGKISIKGQFKNDLKTGIWIYYEKGKKIREENKDLVKTPSSPKPKIIEK